MFCGLLPLVRELLEEAGDLSREQKLSLAPYLDLIRDRASGRLLGSGNGMCLSICRPSDD